MSGVPEKINNRKISHSQKPHSSLRPKKGGAGGRGAWGSPMDDLKFMERDAEPTNDPQDPNFDGEEEIILMTSDDDGDDLENPKPNRTDAEKFQSDVESLVTFKIDVEKWTREFFLSDEDEETFIKNVETSGCPQFYNQVAKQLLFVTIGVGEPNTYRPVRQLLDNLCAKGIVNKAQLESAYRRLFHRVNELSLSNRNAYDVLQEFAEYAVDKGHIDQEFLTTLIKQTEFARDPVRVDRLKNHIKGIIEEYFSSGDIGEAIRCVVDMKTPFYNFEMVKRILSNSLDRDNRCREQCSLFLASAVGDGDDDAIDRRSAELGFSIVLQRVEDLYKDVPDVLHLLSGFVARAISDEVLSMAFLDHVQLLEDDMGFAVIDHARTLLRGKRAFSRLANVWGMSSEKDVRTLKAAVAVLIKEFLVSEDMNEAIQSIKELNVSMFHHELVKQIVIAVADWRPPNVTGLVQSDDKQRKADQVIDLLATCFKNNIIAKEQLEQGFKRLRDRIDDIKLDSPRIEKYYNEIALHFKGVPLCGATQ